MKEKTKLIWVVIIIIISILYAGNVFYKNYFNPYAKVGEEITWNDLQPADVILIQEQWIIGWIPGFWSHTVIFDEYDETGQGWIIESKYDGVKRKKIDNVLKWKNREKIILRLKNATPEIQNKIIANVHANLGQNFDYNWLTKDDVDNKFIYCSELIWKAYLLEGYDLDVNPTAVWPYFNGIAPQEIYDSDLMEKYYVLD